MKNEKTTKHKQKMKTKNIYKEMCFLNSRIRKKKNNMNYVPPSILLDRSREGHVQIWAQVSFVALVHNFVTSALPDSDPCPAIVGPTA